MPASGWMRRWRGGRNERGLGAPPILVPARGESSGDLVRSGARALLETAGADRAGVWLAPERGGPFAAGCVAEADPGPIPEEWKRLDLSTPDLQAALAGGGLIRPEPVEGDADRRIGPLIGMRSVIWIALRARGRTLGLAMAAHAKPPGPLELGALHARGEEIALDALHERNGRRIERTAEETRAHSSISRAILCGVSVGHVLRQIARTARQYTYAEFVAIGSADSPAGGVEAWDGPGDASAVLHHEITRQLWRNALQTSHESEISGHAAARLFAGSPGGSHALLDRIVALPIESRSGTRGVLMAGFSQFEDSRESFARLESYALLAASALDREAAWQDRSASAETHRHMAEEKEQLETEIAGLLESIDSGALLVDAEGRIARASNRLGTIFGIEARRLLEFGSIQGLIDGVAQQCLRPAETAARWREHLRQAAEASWDEFEIARPARKIVERFTRPLHLADGAPLGWLQIFRDITSARRIESELLQTEKMAALGQLVSGIAHELNNPLTSIQGYAQLLLGRRSGPDRAADVLRISQEGERAGRIVKNLLLFSREAKPERRAVGLNEVIERTLALRAYELKLENIRVDLALDPALPPTLGDAAQLQQAALNLIVNAEQAIVMAREDEARGGRILIRTERLAGDHVALRVSDDGPGIAPEIAPRIFDPFFTTKPPGVGTGLGLSIVYGIVREHGGEISVDSLPGRGATVSIELPALAASGFDFAREEPPPERRAAVVPLLPADRAATKERILVVEDEPTVAELISDVMADQGYRVETLLDSREALGKLEEQNYSLVICDLKMPYLDGPGLYRALVRRENPIRHRLLFVTGDTMAPRTIEFLKSSGLPYLAKPFLVEELKEAVSNALAAVRSGERPAIAPDRPRAAARES